MCGSKPINHSKPTSPRKPSKGKHNARLVDSKGPSDDEAVTPASVESDSSEEYTFNTGAQGHQRAKTIFLVKIMNLHNGRFRGDGEHFEQERLDGLKEKPKLTKTNVKVYPYVSSKPLNVHSKLRVSVASDHLSSEETF